MSLQPKSYISELSPYQPGMPIEAVARKYGLQPEHVLKLASNENPLGMSPKARAALVWALPEAHRYPDQYDLTHALSKKLGVDASCIVLGNGSNDVLDLVARTYLGVGDESVSAQFAFSIYVIATQSTGATNVIVSAKDYGHDLQAMLAAVTLATKVVWIANPNNPTGTFVPYSAIQWFLENIPRNVVVVLDEAYYEYLDHDDQVESPQWTQQYSNLIITRTFSKIYGLAGLRVGYAIASPKVAALLQRVRQPFNVNVPALAAAMAALGDDEFADRSRTLNAAGKKQLSAGLEKLGLRCLPSYGNFVTFAVANAADVNEQLLQQGIIVRPLAGNGMPNWLRVTVSTPGDNQRFLQTLEKLLP